MTSTTHADPFAALMDTIGALRAHQDAILAEVAALRHELRLSRLPVQARVAALVAAIHVSAVGERPFSVGDLLDFARREDPTLCQALDDLFGLNGKAIGRGLLRVAGRDVHGLRVRRAGDEAFGAEWQIAPVRLSGANGAGKRRARSTV